MIKNGEFCVYNGNEYELNEDSNGNLIIITTNRAIIDETFVDKYNSGVYSKVILPNEIGEAYDCQTYGVIKGSRVNVEKENEEYYKIIVFKYSEEKTIENSKYHYNPGVSSLEYGQAVYFHIQNNKYSVTYDETGMATFPRLDLSM